MGGGKIPDEIQSQLQNVKIIFPTMEPSLHY